MSRPGTDTETVGFPVHSVPEDNELHPMAEREAADSLHLKGSLLLGQSALFVKCTLPCVASFSPALGRPPAGLGSVGKAYRPVG